MLPRQCGHPLMFSMKIAIASDHAGFALKQYIRKHLAAAGHLVEDFGTRSEESCDFVDYAYPAALAVSEGRAERAVLVDGAGYPSAIVANMLPGCFAAVANDPVSAHFARSHSDTNILCLGGKIVGEAMATAIVDEWMNGKFLGGKYAARVEKLRAVGERHRPRANTAPLKVLTVQDIRDAIAHKKPLLITDQTIITPAAQELV